MKWAVVPCAILAVLLFDNGAHADSCELKLENGSVGVWHGQCRDGMPYGKGELTYNGKTYRGAVEDGKSNWVRFRLEDEGPGDARQFGGQRRVGSESKGPATGQDSQGRLDGSAVAGGNRGKSAEDVEAGPPPASADARKTYGFREYDAVDGESRDRGEPAEDEDAKAPPASTAARSPEPPAPDSAVPDSALKEAPAHAGPAAAPCKLEVAGKFYDWSGPCTGDGKADGEGKATGPDGSTYTGSAKNGKRHGYGTVTAPGGYWFQGRFRNGLAHGEATFRDPDGNYFRARFENGEEVGKRVPVAYASLDKGEPDNTDNTGGEAAESKQWNDSTGSVEGEGRDPGAATDGSGPAPAGEGSVTGDPAYVAALEKLEGRRKAGPAAPDDGYVAAIGRLERREAERRMAAQRAIEREAAQLRARIAREQSRKRAARSAAERQRRREALDRKAERAAARLNRDMEAERARRSRAEGQRRSKALLDRNLKMAGLQRRLNREISNCNSRAQNYMNRELAACRSMHVTCRGASCAQNARIRCANQARNSGPIMRRQCEAWARSAYRRSIAALLAQKY